MDCERLGEQLSALVDGELDSLRAWRLRRHLRGCARCSAELAVLRETRAATRRHAAAGADAPPGFWAAVSRRLEAVDAQTPRRRRAPPLPVRRAVLLALVLAVGALAVLLIRRPAPVEPAWIAARHAQPLPPPGSTAARDTRILTMSPTDASAWLSRRLGAKIPPVDLELVGLELRGAMGWAERGRRIGLLRYTRGLEPWSLLVIPSGGELTGSREVTAGRQRFGTSAADGSLMAAWHSWGTLFVLAGPGPEGELLRAARQAARACEVGR